MRRGSCRRSPAAPARPPEARSIAIGSRHDGAVPSLTRGDPRIGLWGAGKRLGSETGRSLAPRGRVNRAAFVFGVRAGRVDSRGRLGQGVETEIYRDRGARRQEQTFADWCVEIRDLAGERWPDFSDQAPTLYAVWGGGATPQQALYMVGLILPPKAAA